MRCCCFAQVSVVALPQWVREKHLTNAAFTDEDEAMCGSGNLGIREQKSLNVRHLATQYLRPTRAGLMTMQSQTPTRDEILSATLQNNDHVIQVDDTRTGISLKRTNVIENCSYNTQMRQNKVLPKK